MADQSTLTRRQRLSRLDVRLCPYLYILPFFLLFALVGLFPLLYTFWVSTHEWHLIGGQGDFVGFDNSPLTTFFARCPSELAIRRVIQKLSTPTATDRPMPPRSRKSRFPR